MNVLTLRERQFAVPINCLLAMLQCIEWPGKHRFYQWMCKTHPNRLIKHQISGNEFILPVDEWCFWLEKGPENYYLDEFVPFFDYVTQLTSEVSFFDLGADIGTVSVLANKYCKNIKHIYAFEPNPKSFQLLSENLKQLPLDTNCQNMAVSDFNGYASFTSSPNRSIDHEGSIDPKRQGNTQVVTLDSWVSSTRSPISENVVIKIDVEGQEEQAINGAKELIARASKVIVLLEIHPDVLSKTDTSPEQLLNGLELIREFDWIVPAIDSRHIDRNRAFFEQFPKKQYDLIAISK